MRVALVLMLGVVCSGWCQDEPVTFKTRVNLVSVPVVVRDDQGRVVSNLTKDDFELFDRGKPQSISRFSVEVLDRVRAVPVSVAPKPGEPAPPPVAPEVPQRYVAYLIDDVHLTAADMVYMREATRKHVKNALLRTDRAAIWTTSGVGSIEFTDDHDALDKALMKLMPRPQFQQSSFECPSLTYYEADLIENKHDRTALDVATEEVLSCANMDRRQREVAMKMAQNAAKQVVQMAGFETRMTLLTLRDAVRRMAAAPGQRVIILASPGFLTPDHQSEKSDVLERAIKANVVINSIDARGLYTDPVFDASRRMNGGPQVMIQKATYLRQETAFRADVLAEMAAGTGGKFFQNSNDLDEGLRRLASAPETIYVLGFSPQDLKPDGAFHALKVNVKVRKMSVSARKGYYAPKVETAASAEKQKIAEATFSNQESRELPIDLQTQFFRRGADSARLSTLARIQLNELPFQKVEGRNRNKLNIVSSLFDGNGNYVTGTRKELDMNLRDETLLAYAKSGLLLRTNFDVKPGRYLVRMVVTDEEERSVTSANGVVEMTVPPEMPAPRVSDAYWLQAPYFYSEPGVARVHLSVDVPAEGMQYEAIEGRYTGTYEVRGVAYRGDDVAGGFEEKVRVEAPSKEALDDLLKGTVFYEGQFEMAPGDYRLKVQFRSGDKEMVTLESPLSIAPQEQDRFQISGVLLSKAIRKLAEGITRKPAIPDESRVPLMATGYQFYPAGGTSFKASDPVTMYFEGYNAKSAALTVRMKISDRKTGDVKLDSGAVDISKMMDAGDSHVYVGLRLPTENVGAGEYRLELTAANGGQESTRTVDFELR